MTKKSHKKFSAAKWKFFPKSHSKNFVREISFRPPKLGARSPPMHKVSLQRQKPLPATADRSDEYRYKVNLTRMRLSFLDRWLGYYSARDVHGCQRRVI